MAGLWNWFTTYSDQITAFTAILAGIIAFFAWQISRRTTRYQIINELFLEYRSYDMGKAMQTIWDFRRECEEKIKKSKVSIEDELVENYYKQYKKDCISKDSLHMQRRKVSMYFQNLACLAIKDIKIMKAINEIWTGSDMITIPNIIEIIEMRAMPKCINKKEILNRRDYPGYMNNMIYLHESIPGTQFKFIIIRIRRRMLLILGLRK